ncbi:MAG TPA: MarR family transcriptional regulator [Silvibacterium sp.]|jgi:MarR family 2-MHQ and catechol resistance regulon transcriptional repressor|nr:MarR family transcriptional regulator [Silvibacterium sp.]
MGQHANIPAARLWTVFAKAHRALSAHVEDSVARHRLCLSDFMALEALLHKGPLTVGEIGNRVLLTSGSMTAAVDRLEKMGLVRREFTEKDRRARVIHLTQRGRRLVKTVFEAHSQDLEALMAVLDDDERTELYRLLKKLGFAAAAAPREEQKRFLSNRSKGRKTNNVTDSEK